EIGTVDDHQHVRPRGDHRVGGLADALDDGRQPRRDRGKADEREVTERIEAGEALRRHLRAADTGDAYAAISRRLERGDQRAAQEVAGLLHRHQKNMRAHRSVSAATPTTKILARSAATTIRSGSARMLLPAVTAMPASPARATFSTVRGPIEGRSKRASCPRLGAFTSTPVPAVERTRPLARISATRASMASVPSAASTASTCLSTTTTAWPMSNGPLARK